MDEKEVPPRKQMTSLESLKGKRQSPVYATCGNVVLNILHVQIDALRDWAGQGGNMWKGPDLAAPGQSPRYSFPATIEWIGMSPCSLDLE